MKKIHFRIIGLVLISLTALGISMSLISIMELRSLGNENIRTLDEKLREDFDRMSSSQVESAVSIIQYFYDLKDTLGEDTAKEMARQAIISMRYGKDGYIFIYNSDGVTIAKLGDKDEGVNRWDVQDAKGNYLIRNIVDAAKEGTGFTTYWNNRPGESEPSPKRSYNQYFSPWDWIVGTGNYIDDIDAIIYQEQEYINKIVNNTTLIIILSDLAIMVIAMIFSWFIGKRISKPVEHLAREARKIAEGDLTVDIAVMSKDETGELALAFKEMISKLNMVINGIIETAVTIESNSREVSASSQQVATGASEQASSAEEISASMEELSANIQQNTENSRQSNKIVSQAASDAEIGGKAVVETVSSMNFISEKINVIEEIARSTNLLALNAAIEAARAGEAGKGFAVVASEIRKLAETSQSAAKDITEVSKESVEKAEETRTLIQEIIPVIKKSADIAEEIMEGSNEQAKGAEQINSALLQMDEVIQSNASASEEIAGMAAVLSDKSEELTKIVSFFKIKTSEKENSSLLLTDINRD